MKTCEVCGNGIPDEVGECVPCKEAREKPPPGPAAPPPVLKRFKGFATVKGKKYTGVFEAFDEEDARQRLSNQGFEFIRVELDKPAPPKKNNILREYFRKLLKLCSAYPIVLAIPPLLILLVLTYNEKSRDAIHEPKAVVVRYEAPKVGDLVTLKGGYFLGEDKKIFATAVLYQRSGNTVAFQRIFSEHPMMITKDGMSVFFEGRDGIVPGAIKVRFQESQGLMYTDYEAIKLGPPVEAAVNAPADSAGNA